MDDGGWKQVKLVDNGLGKPSSYRVFFFDWSRPEKF